MSKEKISSSDIRSWIVGSWTRRWKGRGLGSFRENAFKEGGDASGWELSRKDRKLLDSSNRRMPMEVAMEAKKGEQTLYTARSVSCTSRFTLCNARPK